MRTRHDVESELLMKERRVSYWDAFGLVPDADELAGVYDVELEVKE